MSVFRKRLGFTLVELVIIASTILILIAILIPNVLKSIKLSRYAKAKSFVKNISDAAEVYQAVTGRFPTTITSLTSTTPPFIDPFLANKFCNPDVTLTKVVDNYGYSCMFNLLAGGEDYAYYVYADEMDGNGFYLVALYQAGANRGKYLFNETQP